MQVNSKEYIAWRCQQVARREQLDAAIRANGAEQREEGGAALIGWLIIVAVFSLASFVLGCSFMAARVQ